MKQITKSKISLLNLILLPLFLTFLVAQNYAITGGASGTLINGVDVLEVRII